ncbi:hypothetical protein GCM10010123_16730 [Pilimelia anulata]|uniref:Molybdopterin molybdenumtransferase n=1 Tax=Pilimelia anulata TaxID=53371 RepID=A0A8J3F8C5_9ACTN|nr:hypothetical protein GCM10010123_16730 [Pilimelia anulata]
MTPHPSPPADPAPAPTAAVSPAAAHLDERVVGGRARVVVASDRAAAGRYADRSGPLLADGLRALGYAVEVVVVPDGPPVAAALRDALAAGLDLVLTSGGTGVSRTDRTPEATAPLLDRPLPGIAEAIRARGARSVPTAALSRGLAGVAGSTLVVNVAGSPGAARDALAVLGPLLPHTLAQLRPAPAPAPAPAPVPAPAAAADEPPDADPSPAAEPAGAAAGCGGGGALAWAEARVAAHAAARPLPPVDVPVGRAAGGALAAPLAARTALPAYDTSSVDGYAVRGPGPWRPVGRVLAGQRPEPLVADGTAAEVATGAMLPAGSTAVIRVEEVTRRGDRIHGTPRPAGAPVPEWRPAGAEAAAGAELLPAGTVVTPAVAGLAAACGYDRLPLRRAPRLALRVFGDELRTAGPAGDGRLRDALGPALPALLRALGGAVADPPPPIADTLDAHVAALRGALADADVVCTTGGTMRGPADHLHPALAALGARYVVDTVAVRPGYPMLLARVGDRFVVGLPGNPQSAVIAALTLVGPLLAGLAGRPLPALAAVRAGVALGGRGADTHLALVRVAGGGAEPVPYVGSAMLRGLALADGYAVIAPGGGAAAGDEVPYLPLPPAPPPEYGAADRAAGNAVASGSGVVIAAVGAAPLDPAAHEAAVRHPAAGAVAGFAGVVRDHDGGRAVVGLEYEAHPDAAAVLAGIAAEVAADPAVRAVAVSHRVGPLAVGEVALCAAVSSAHRGPAFAAVAHLVELVKERLPVWKRQRFADGTQEWVNCA